MSTHPARLEARVSAQERQQVILNARIEELAQDINESFKQLADYQVKTEQQIETHFNQVEARLSQIEITMATKEDMAAMEGRILAAFNQLVSIIHPQLPPKTP